MSKVSGLKHFLGVPKVCLVSKSLGAQKKRPFSKGFATFKQKTPYFP